MPLLSIEQVTKQYPLHNGFHTALNGVSLDIHAGEILSLLGVNGAGKTTLSSIIATLHPPTGGDIKYRDQSIYTNLPVFRRTIGYCPQAPNLNNMLTLEENLTLAGHYYGLEAAVITERINTLVKQFGLTKYLREKASILSGGYKQRFMIARSIIHTPELLILDEPTVGLDPHIRRQLWQIIQELKQAGMTILLTTHYLDEAEKLSDRVCILDKGSIMLIDAPDTLIADFKQQNLEDLFIQLLEGTREEQ